MPTNDRTAPGLTRRDALRRGALGGALLWTVPTLQVIGAGSADAASGPPSPPPPPPPPPAPTCIPSNGLLYFLLRGVTYGVKIDKAGSIGKVPTNAQFAVPTPTSYSNYSGSITGGKLAGNTGLFLILPTGATFVAAYVADGNPTGQQGGGNHGHDFVSVSPDAQGLLKYTKVCG